MLINFSGTYAEWNYEDIKSLNYCPYTPFLFSFIVLILSCILIVCASCAMLNEYGHNRRENIERRRTARTNNRIDYEYLEWLKTKMNKNILIATTWWYNTLSSLMTSHVFWPFFTYLPHSSPQRLAGEKKLQL